MLKEGQLCCQEVNVSSTANRFCASLSSLLLLAQIRSTARPYCNITVPAQAASKNERSTRSQHPPRRRKEGYVGFG